MTKQYTGKGNIDIKCMEMHFWSMYFLNCICIMSIYVINYTICRLHHCNNTVYNHYYLNYKKTRKTIQCEPKR